MVKGLQQVKSTYTAVAVPVQQMYAHHILHMLRRWNEGKWPFRGFTLKLTLASLYSLTSREEPFEEGTAYRLPPYHEYSLINFFLLH